MVSGSAFGSVVSGSGMQGKKRFWVLKFRGLT